jgi:probable F420-dependent oxidoreductase
MERLGLTLGLVGAPLDQALEICRDAESLGYTDVWSAEVGGSDAFAVLAALAPLTQKMRLGTAIIPVFTRPVALTAMGAATVQNLSKGRFVLGLGTSSRIIVERWMARSFDAPLSTLEDTVTGVREIFSGKKVRLEGRVSATDFRLEIGVEPPPVYIAALGPKACRLAGRIADGVIFFLKTPDGVRQSLEHVHAGAREAGRDPDSIDVVARVPVAIDEEPDLYRFMSQRLITNYAMVDVYNRSLASQGFADEVAAIAKAWAEGDRNAATASVTDEMIGQLQIHGSAAECRASLAEFRAAGVKTPVLFPFSLAGDPGAITTKVRSVVELMAPPTP